MKGHGILIKKVTCRAGLTGVLVILLGIAISAVAFKGAYGEAYSILNHNISELGEQGVSELAWLFNISLIVGGLCLIVFMLGLSMSTRQWPVHLVSLSGVVAIAGMSLSALTPIVAGETSGLHIDAARLFFYGGMLSTFVYSLYVLLDKRCWFPKWTVLTSLLALLSFWAFIYVPAMIYPGFTVEDYLVRLQGEQRPVLWLPSLLEWLVLFSSLLWIGFIVRFVCLERGKSQTNGY